MIERNILIVDDHPLIYEGLKNTLLGYGLFHVASAGAARQLLESKAFYAHILDITLGKENGLDLARTLVGSRESAVVFILSMHETPIFIQQARDLGARGYFLKDEPLGLITEALENPFGREFWASKRIQMLLDKSTTQTDTLYELLTRREQQIFRMLAEGMNYNEIAANLDISAKTVNVHRSQLMTKLGITSQNELFRLAVKLEIVRI